MILSWLNFVEARFIYKLFRLRNSNSNSWKTEHSQFVSTLWNYFWSQLDNIILGLTSCSSRHSCVFCKSKKTKWMSVGLKVKQELLKISWKINQLWEEQSNNREALKHFYNVAFKPLIKTPSYKLLENNFSSTKTIPILPPPDLHVILLGPVNYLWKYLCEIYEMTPFEEQYRLVKSDKQKKEFQGARNFVESSMRWENFFLIDSSFCGHAWKYFWSLQYFSCSHCSSKS